MLYGLPRKIRTAFLLQTLLASLAGLLGGYLILLVIKFGLVNAVLQEEAAYYRELHAASPAQPPLQPAQGDRQAVRSPLAAYRAERGISHRRHRRPVGLSRRY